MQTAATSVLQQFGAKQESANPPSVLLRRRGRGRARSKEVAKTMIAVLPVVVMIKTKSFVVIAFCYRKANILQRWSNTLHFFYGNKGLCHGCRS